MKYIIIPPFKFIVAVLLSILFIIVNFIGTLFYVLWYFKELPDDFYKYTYYPGEFEKSWSVYYKRNPNNFSKVYFKTVFHFIWNIR